jgi:excisionase family DNA binding protein
MTLLTVSEVATALNISQSKVFKMAASGELESVKIGKSLRFIEEQINRFVLQNVKGKRK